MDKILALAKSNQTITSLITVVIIIMVIYLLQFILSKVVRAILFKYNKQSLYIIPKYMKIPIIFLSIVLIVYLSLFFFDLSATSNRIIRHILLASTIILIAWLISNGITLIRRLILSKYNMQVADNLTARKMHTQLAVVERIINILIVIITIASLLMTIDQIRQVGLSLLASAGLLTAIVGFAAQKSLASLLAGVQIAITQPIRIDDVVIVENEWGIIEEINLSYVVVRVWDKRRLIVPISYFLEKPFQNWSYSSTDLLGTVFIYTDYQVSLNELNEELTRIVKTTPLWDSQVTVLQMTDIKAEVVELRAVISAKNAGDLFNLRCYVRENLLSYITKHYPSSLPRTRINFENSQIPNEKPQL